MADNDNDKNQVPAQIFLQTSTDPESDEESESNMDLSVYLDYLDMIRNRLWLFLAVPILIVAIAFVKVYTATPVYKSTCQLQIQPRPVEVSGVRSFYDPMAGTRDLTQFINTEIQLMKTPDVLNRVFEELQLSSDPEFATANPVETLAEKLDVTQKEETFLINVGFKSTEPEKAARIVNYLGELYVRLYQQRKQDISGGGIARLREQLDKIAAARDEALQGLAAFKKKHEVMDLDYERELLSQRISALSETLIEAEMDERQAEEAQATVASWKADGHLGAVVQMIDNSFAESFRMEQLRMEMELPELLSKFGPKHSEVETKRKVISNLQNAVSEEVETSLVALRLEAQRAAKRREVVTETIAELENELMGLDEIGAEYYRMKDTYDAAETAYRKVIARINDVNISVNTDEMQANDFLRVVRRGIPNESPVYPQKRKTLAMAGALGLFLGAGLCVFLGLLDTSVKTNNEVERCLKDPVILGSFPARSEQEDELIAAEQPHSMLAEAFRSIRTSLSLCLTGREERCFAVTSSGPGEGKTTVALNLAIALARDNRKVLLMECDMRRPRLAKTLGETLQGGSENGISKLLVGESDLSSLTARFTLQDGMDVLVSGPIPPNPGELLGTKRFEEILAEAKSKYDYVILDTPPLLNVADTAILAGHGVPLLYVVRLFTASRPDLRHAGDRMQTIQAKCAGVIVNQVEVPRHSHYGYYRYGRYGRYAYSKGYGHSYGYGYGYNSGEDSQTADVPADEGGTKNS